MLALVPCIAAAASPAPMARTKFGTLRGVWSEGGRVAGFKDVPFARAERFEAPQPAANWSGVRDASAYGPGCWQGSPGRNPDVPANQTEDCTRLNVFTPSLLSASRPLPVVVWFHGGAYKEGSSFGPYDIYDGSKFAVAGGVVVVSCAYRLGALGALVHPGGINGNFGFLDQRACLQWVAAEIRGFGGDPGAVTAWGQSAGAQSVWLHMVSPGSAGLFHRAVLESAPNLAAFSRSEAEALGRAVAREAGCSRLTSAETVKCLKGLHASDFVSASNRAEGSVFAIISSVSLAHPSSSFIAFRPHVDGVDLSEQPFSALLNGRAAGAVPSLMGYNHDEMWALLDSIPAWVRGVEAEAALSALFGLEAGARAWAHYSRLYPGDTLAALVKILTDYVFTCSAQAAARALPAPSYIYAFDHLDSFGANLWPRFNKPQCSERACHMAELPLVFNATGPPELNVTFSAAERAISDTLMSAFAAFAHGGAPGTFGWLPFDTSNRSGLVVNATATAGPLGAAGAVCADIWDPAGYVH